MATFKTWAEAIRQIPALKQYERDARLAPRAVSLVPRCTQHDPQAIFTAWMRERYPDGFETEYVFSERHDYRFDGAWPALKLAVEIDGWQYHGKYKKDWVRNMKKDRLAQLERWTVLHFSAREVLQEMPMIVATIGVFQRRLATGP